MENLQETDLIIGNKYRFKNQPESPVLRYKGAFMYIGWHQFYIHDDDSFKIWSELRDSDLWMIEKVKEAYSEKSKPTSNEGE